MGSVFTGAVNLTKPDKFSPASKFIGAVEYDPKAETMTITFRNGTVVKYPNFSPSSYLYFKTSPTQDSYYARAIKGNVQSVKLVDASVGHQKSTPLDKVRKERDLDAGIRKERSKTTRPGTVYRAFAGT